MTEDSLADIFGTEVTADSDSLQTITNLVTKANESQIRLGDYEAKVKEEKEILRSLLEQDIPDAMSAVGMADIGLADGTRVKVDPFHRGAITEKTKAAAHAWLEANGFGGLIKRDLTISFGKGDNGHDGLVAYVREMGLASKEKEAVHPQTLGAFIRNQAEKGEAVPQDLFNVYSGFVTKLSNA